MEQGFKKSIKRCFFTYLSLYFVLFLIFYIPNYVIEDYAYTVGNFEYVRHFLSLLLEFILGASGAVVLFVVLMRTGGVTTGHVLTGAATIAAAKLIYSLPYYYLYFLSLGYDSVDGIPLYTLSALFAVMLEFAKLILFLSLVYFTSRRHIMKELKLTLPAAYRKKPSEKERRALHAAADVRLSDELTVGGVLNFDAPVTLGIFLSSVGQFAYALSAEIKNAADYLTEFAGNYRTDEIIYMTACFVFVIFELIISHVACYYLKNWLLKKLKARA